MKMVKPYTLPGWGIFKSYLLIFKLNMLKALPDNNQADLDLIIFLLSIMSKELKFTSILDLKRSNVGLVRMHIVTIFVLPVSVGFNMEIK